MATRVFPGYAGSRRPPRRCEIHRAAGVAGHRQCDGMVAQRPQLISAALKRAWQGSVRNSKLFCREKSVRPTEVFSLSETSGPRGGDKRTVIPKDLPRARDRDGRRIRHGDHVRHVSVPDETLRRWRLSRPAVSPRRGKIMVLDECGDRQAFRLRKRICRPPKRRVVERTFGWLGRCRRLARDFEATIASAVA